VPEELVHELRTSIFSGILAKEIPHCEECPGEEMCELAVVLMGNGRTMRATADAIGEIPRPVVVWPRCPWDYDALWYPGDNQESDVGAAAPLDWIRWAYERDLHKRRKLPRRSAVLIREWLRLRDIPRVLSETRAADDARERASAKRGSK